MELIRDILAILGGTGIIVLALFKFLGGVWRDRIKEKGRRDTEELLEASRQRYVTRRIQTDKYAQSQYEVYIDLWKSFQGLRLAVDSLWNRATKNNIEVLANELATSKDKTDRWSIFIESHRLEELRELYKVLENFEAGKVRLMEIRSREDLKEISLKQTRIQIEQNGRLRDDFVKLLEELCESFRSRLSGIDLP